MILLQIVIELAITRKVYPLIVTCRSSNYTTRFLSPREIEEWKVKGAQNSESGEALARLAAAEMKFQ
jgi:hypothetical protein